MSKNEVKALYPASPRRLTASTHFFAFFLLKSFAKYTTCFTGLLHRPKSSHRSKIRRTCTFWPCDKFSVLSCFVHELCISDAYRMSRNMKMYELSHHHLCPHLLLPVLRWPRFTIFISICGIEESGVYQVTKRKELSAAGEVTDLCQLIDTLSFDECSAWYWLWKTLRILLFIYS